MHEKSEKEYGHGVRPQNSIEHQANASAEYSGADRRGQLGALQAASHLVHRPPGRIRARRSDTALTATMMEESDIRSADTSGRSDQPSGR
jgi:hypothetical protein